MEYIYCKNGEEYECAKRVLSDEGYKNHKAVSGFDWILYTAAWEDTPKRRGITLYVSDDEMTVYHNVGVGFQPNGYKPSKLMSVTDIDGNFYTNINLYNSKSYVDLKKDLATNLNTELKTDLEPLDDTEELEADREKLRKFAKDTKGKAKITLAPMQILKDVAEVREYGVKKYGSVDSWKEVPIEDYRDALFRHLLEYVKDPNSVDKESGIKHYKHIACNLAFICEMENMEDGTRSI